MHRPAALAVAVLACLLAAGCASSPPAAPAHDDAKHGSVRVIGHHCDDSGAVDSLALKVEGEGAAMLRWTNEGVCGKPA